MHAGNADFHYNNHCINNLIYFEDLSSSVDKIVSWYWEFGDGSIATDDSPVHAYAESGRYDVSLTVKTISGKEYSESKSIDIKAAPFAFFNPNNKCDQTVGFKDNSFTRATQVKMWMWDFGDGNYSLEQNPEHRFDNAARSDVHLKVLDKNGCWDSITQSVNVIENPQVGFDINSVILSNPAIIKINSHNNKDSVFYLINNQIVNDKNTLITLPPTENIEIKQKVINSKGCTDSSSLELNTHKDYSLPLPAVFTPNFGNNTSSFGVSNKNIVVKEFSIFNSNGQLVFKTEKNENWNGQLSNGAKAKNGIYIYALSYANSNKTNILQKGKFILKN